MIKIVQGLVEYVWFILVLLYIVFLHFIKSILISKLACQLLYCLTLTAQPPWRQANYIKCVKSQSENFGWRQLLLGPFFPQEKQFTRYNAYAFCHRPCRLKILNSQFYSVLSLVLVFLKIVNTSSTELAREKACLQNYLKNKHKITKTFKQKSMIN